MTRSQQFFRQLRLQNFLPLHCHTYSSHQPSNRPFPSSPGPLFQTRVGAQPVIWKPPLILMQIKLIFTRKVVHLASFWKWGFLELESGLFWWHKECSSTKSKAQCGSISSELLCIVWSNQLLGLRLGWLIMMITFIILVNQCWLKVSDQVIY